METGRCDFDLHIAMPNFDHLGAGSRELGMAEMIDLPINMGDPVRVKTTLEIPDSTYRRAKATAARRGQTVAAFISAAVEAKLAAEERGIKERPWMEFAGVFQSERQESKRILKRIEKACERIHPEDWQ
jgi:hypothetical protein